VPEYLYDMGRLDTSVPFAQLFEQAHVNPVARALDEQADFSSAIRAPIPGD
jgi:hypothetical protein